VVLATARLIHLTRTDQDDGIRVSGRLAVNQPLGAARGRAAYYADRVELVHHFSLGHQQRHRSKRLAPKVQIQAGDDHSQPTVSQQPRDVRHAPIEELCLVDCHHICLRVKLLQDLHRPLDYLCHVLPPVVRGNAHGVIPVVDQRLENLDALARDFCPAHAADQFLGLTAEHASADDLDPPASRLEVGGHASRPPKKKAGYQASGIQLSAVNLLAFAR